MPEAVRMKGVPGEIYSTGDFIVCSDDGRALRGPFRMDQKPIGVVNGWDQEAGEVSVLTVTKG